MTAYSTLVYHGTATNAANATSYTFLNKNLGTARNTRAIHVVVTYYGTSGIPNMQVTVGTTPLVLKSRAHSTSSQYPGVAHFAEFVTTGTAADIIVQSNITLSNCAITWYSFDPRSLDPVSTANIVQGGYQITTAAFNTVGGGISFAGVASTGTTTGGQYYGDDNGTLVTTQSNLTVEALLSYAQGYVITETDSSLGKILYTAGSNTIRALSVCSYGPDTPTQAFGGKVGDTFSASSSGSYALVYNQYQYLGAYTAPDQTVANVKTVTFTNVNLGDEHNKRAIIVLVALRPFASLDSITTTGCTLDGTSMNLIITYGSGLYASSGSGSYIAFYPTGNTASNIVITTSHGWKNCSIFVFKLAPLVPVALDKYAASGNTGNITAYDLESDRRGMNFVFTVAPYTATQTYSWTDTQDKWEKVVTDYQIDQVNNYVTNIARLQVTPASTTYDASWSGSFMARHAQFFSLPQHYIPIQLGIIETPFFSEDPFSIQWYASTEVSSTAYLTSIGRMNGRTATAAVSGFTIGTSSVEQHVINELFEHFRVTNTVARANRVFKSLLSSMSMASTNARRMIGKSTTSDSFNAGASESHVCKFPKTLRDYPRISNTLPQPVHGVWRRDMFSVRDLKPTNERNMFYSETHNLELHDAYAYTFEIEKSLHDALNITRQVATTRSRKGQISDAVKFTTALTSAMPAFLNDTVNLAIVFTLFRSLKVLQRLKISIAPNNDVTCIYGMSLTDRMKLGDALRKFISGDVDQLINMQSVMLPTYRPRSSILEKIGLDDSEVPKLLINVKAASQINLDDFNVLKYIFRPTIKQDIAILAAYVAPGNSFTTWAVNTRSGATTEYTNFPFNSFAARNRKYLAASENGLYELLGEDDDGDDIVSRIRTGFAQFGGSHFTSFKAAYLGMRSEGDFVFKIISGDDKEYIYAVKAQDMRTTKIQLGKGLRSRYFAFELISSGQDFDLDTIEFIPLVAQRRI